MFIQGNLQIVFDALYSLGAINPALKADWAPADQKKRQDPRQLNEAISRVNGCGGNLKSIIENLKNFDQETLLLLAMEVAREFVDFEDCKTLH